MYGCDSKQDHLETRMFPFILSKLSQMFDFEETRFSVSYAKEATARIAMFKDLKNVP